MPYPESPFVKLDEELQMQFNNLPNQFRVSLKYAGKSCWSTCNYELPLCFMRGNLIWILGYLKY